MRLSPRLETEDGLNQFCNKCQEWKPLTTEFWYWSESRNAWHTPCKKCTRSYTNGYNAEHRNEARRNARSAAMKYKYGITVEEYNDLLRKQDGVCAVCGSTGFGRRLSVDHCHTTGHVRGLLCYKCNTGAGMLNDDPALVAKLLLYLER